MLVSMFTRKKQTQHNNKIQRTLHWKKTKLKIIKRLRTLKLGLLLILCAHCVSNLCSLFYVTCKKNVKRVKCKTSSDKRNTDWLIDWLVTLIKEHMGHNTAIYDTDGHLPSEVGPPVRKLPIVFTCTTKCIHFLQRRIQNISKLNTTNRWRN